MCHPNFQDHTIHNSIWLFRQYKNGFLGFEGPLTEQPSKYIELMRFLEKLNTEYEESQILEQQRKGK